LIQGLTEFLPVSSSGHLILLPYLLGWHEQGLEMDVALHAGTLMAVILYFRQDIWNMLSSAVRYCLNGFHSRYYNDSVQLAFSLIVATLPAVITGYFLKNAGFGDLRQIHVIAINSIVFGMVLFAADHLGSQNKGIRHINMRTGLLLGCAQAIALVPGVSRSGICMSAALALGFTRVAAARFAFLLSIPSITSAVTLTLYDALKADNSIVWKDLGLGMLFSGLAGLAAIHFMLRFLNRHSLNCFVIYRVLLGLALWLIM
jgi:undecaprenyl-diphosphatase